MKVQTSGCVISGLARRAVRYEKDFSRNNALAILRPRLKALAKGFRYDVILMERRRFY